MFSNGSSGDKVFYPWSSDISAFLLLQCAVAFRHSLSSGCKVSPARWLVRASAQIGLNRPQSHQCCFPTPFVSELRPNTKLIYPLYEGYAEANLKTVLRFLRILARKIYAQGGKKEKRFPPFTYKKSPPPITFLMVHTYFSKMSSQMMRNKGMRRTEIWALLLVRLLLEDRKLK